MINDLKVLKQTNFIIDFNTLNQSVIFMLNQYSHKIIDNKYN